MEGAAKEIFLLESRPPPLTTLSLSKRPLVLVLLLLLLLLLLLFLLLLPDSKLFKVADSLSSFFTSANLFPRYPLPAKRRERGVRNFLPLLPPIAQSTNFSGRQKLMKCHSEMAEEKENQGGEIKNFSFGVASVFPPRFSFLLFQDLLSHTYQEEFLVQKLQGKKN